MTLNFFVSGHMFPLDLLPPPWAGLLKALPFQYLAYFPAVVFLGKVQGLGAGAAACWSSWPGPWSSSCWRGCCTALGLRRYSAFGG